MSGWGIKWVFYKKAQGRAVSFVGLPVRVGLPGLDDGLHILKTGQKLERCRKKEYSVLDHPGTRATTGQMRSKIY